MRDSIIGKEFGSRLEQCHFFEIDKSNYHVLQPMNINLQGWLDHLGNWAQMNSEYLYQTPSRKVLKINYLK